MKLQHVTMTDQQQMMDDGSCTFVDGVCETCEDGLVVDNDADDDGVCDADELAGCTDATACNYDASATDDDGSCYNNDLGCGCDTPAADAGYDCDGNCLADADGDGVCDEFEVAGCTDLFASNYSAGATDDDGSCTYDCFPVTIDFGWDAYVDENNWSLYEMVEGLSLDADDVNGHFLGGGFFSSYIFFNIILMVFRTISNRYIYIMFLMILEMVLLMVLFLLVVLQRFIQEDL